MSSPMSSPKTLRLAAMVMACLFATQPHAQQADLSDVPLANSPSDTVLPNLMYILDDSGSMAWDYMPDNIHSLSSGTDINNCKNFSTTATSSFSRVQCANSSVSTIAEAPYYAAGFNQVYYNPNITYSAGVDSTGTSMGDQPLASAMFDRYLNTSTKDLATKYQEYVYCNTNSPTAGDLINPLICKRNGIQNVSVLVPYFMYWGNAGANIAFPVATGTGATSFIYKKSINTNPYYFNIAAHEFCSDSNLTTCALATAAGAAPAGFSIPAPIRYCKTLADAQATTAITGTSGSPATPRCRKKFDVSNYLYPRYGRFSRVDIVGTTPVYVKGPASTRTDCLLPATCTYAEEAKNFANWFTYYRTRLAMMKTATGRAFLPIDDRYRVGFITINPNSPVTASKFLKVSKFDAAQRLSWYTKLYAQSTNGSTPLREALSRVGRYYANKTTGINSGMADDPITYSCQQNFALLTTDGYWNSNSGDDLAGSAVGNQDNNNTGFTTRAVGAYDGAVSGASDTLGDVAAYYYKNDLRTAGAASIITNNVPTTAKDTAAHQHMVTFTLGLGIQGLMDYTQDYETNVTSDYAKIKAGGTGTCSWTSGVCNWPLPAQNAPSAI
ncbi:MAG: pyrrolo-quinoline quinone, partial [Betaproteobacteria bacterium]